MTADLLEPEIVTTSRLQRIPPGAQAGKDRRRHRRAAVLPMYTAVVVRVLNERRQPLEGHAVNVSESGMAVEVDNRIPTGTPVTVEFTVAGMGQMRGQQWPIFAAAAEVVRDATAEDFPHGPYRLGLRFMRISSITQGQIARFVVAHNMAG